MLRDLFDFKKTKTPAEALVFYGVCAAAYFVLAWAVDRVMDGGPLIGF